MKQPDSSGGSATRVVRLISALSQMTDGVGVRELAVATGLATATTHRMLADLEAMGLAYRDTSRRYFPNFIFARQVSYGAEDLAVARAAAERLSRQLGVATEIVVPHESSLLWHAKFEPADQSIRLRAHAGFTRTMHELDAISRLSLAYRPIEEIETVYDTTAFYETGVEARKLMWDEARALIAGVDPAGVAFDMQGNAKGVRRFAVALRNAQGLACLLTIVEAAIPVRDPEGRRRELAAALLATRDACEAPSPPVAEASIATEDNQGGSS
jgi:DNA-binding IclR family transcriptional regulator